MLDSKGQVTDTWRTMKAKPSENPRRAAFWAAVRKHSKPVDWDTVAPVPRALIERNAQVKAIKAAGV